MIFGRIGEKMLNLLKKNYGRTLWIVRIVLALTILLNDLFSINTFYGLMEMMGISTPRVWYAYLFYAIITLLITEVFARIFIKFCFNFLRIYFIPYNEFMVLFLATLALNNLVSGLVKLLYFVTPVIAVFGEILIGFVTSAVAFFILFLVVKKLYLNDKNAPFVFKWFTIIFLFVNALFAFVL